MRNSKYICPRLSVTLEESSQRDSSELGKISQHASYDWIAA